MISGTTPSRSAEPAHRAVRLRAVAGGLLGVVLLLSGCAAAPTTGAAHAVGAAPRRSAPPGSAPTGPAPTGPAHPIAAGDRPTPSVPPTPTPVGFDKAAQSLDDPASPWVVVNKARGLSPVQYAPTDLTYPDVVYVNRQPLRAAAAAALVAMFRAGKSEAGLDFSVQSGYRSFDTQTRVYDDDVARNGRAFADTDTARPGHSEHQTGLAVDISAVPAHCSLDACFGETPQGRWLAANAWRFGFLLRYPADKVAVTGYTYEPWHFRYVGGPLAAELHATRCTTLEEFFGVPGGTLYR